MNLTLTLPLALNHLPNLNLHLTLSRSATRWPTPQSRLDGLDAASKAAIGWSQSPSGETAMARRGRCRCGFILRFEKGKDGYKTRCPECGAVVRLQLQKNPSAPGSRKPTSPATPRRRPRESRPERMGKQAARAQNSEAANPFATFKPAAGTAACLVCGTIIPTRAEHCPSCGAATVRQELEPARSLHSGPRSAVRSRQPPSPRKALLGWIGVAGALLLGAGIALAVFLLK